MQASECWLGKTGERSSALSPSDCGNEDSAKMKCPTILQQQKNHYEICNGSKSYIYDGCHHIIASSHQRMFPRSLVGPEKLHGSPHLSVQNCNLR